MQYETQSQNLQVLTQDIIAHMKRFRILISHNYTRDPLFVSPDANVQTFTEGRNQFILQGHYDINKLWRVGGYVRFDASKHEVNEWQVFATRDLHDFILDLGVNVRYDSIINTDKQFFVNFRMKAFPEYALRTGGGRATFNNPRIGDTVEGANVFSSAREPGGFQESYPIY
jgi:hypothetical protein